MSAPSANALRVALRRGRASGGSQERGSAAVDFTLVAPLVVLVCFGMVQLALWVVQRAEVHSTAFEAARAGAVATGSLADRLEVARRTAREANGPGVAARIDVVAGVRVMVVEVRVRMALLGWDLPMRSTVASHVPLEPT